MHSFRLARGTIKGQLKDKSQEGLTNALVKKDTDRSSI